MYVHYLPSLLHALNLPRPLSILFQMSFLRVLSLLTGHSISCKPSLSRPLISLWLLSILFVVSLLCPFSLTCPMSIVCQTFVRLSLCRSIASWLSHWAFHAWLIYWALCHVHVAESLSVLSCLSLLFQGGHFCNRACISTVNSVLLHVYVHCSIWRCAYPHACYFSTAIYSLCTLAGVCCAVLVVFL